MEYRLAVDLHVHTIASGHAYSTVEEIARRAAAKGLEGVAIADHGPAMAGSGHIYHFWNMQVIPRYMHGVFILRSCEANILNPQGDLDLPGEILDALDIVHAGLHPFCGYEGKSAAENTAALVGALNRKEVDIIVHPGNPAFPIEIDTLAEEAARLGKAIEINNSSFVYTRKGSRENCLAIARALKRTGGPVSLGSDAHIADFAGEFSRALEVIAEAGIALRQVINYDLETLRGFLASRSKPLFLHSDDG